MIEKKAKISTAPVTHVAKQGTDLAIAVQVALEEAGAEVAKEEKEGT